MAISDRFKLNDKKNSNSNVKKNAISFSNNELLNKLFDAVLSKISNIPVWNDYNKAEKKELIETFIDKNLRVDYELDKLIAIEFNELKDNLFSKLFGFGILQSYIDSPDIKFVTIKDTDSIEANENNKIVDLEFALNKLQLDFLINNVLSDSGKKICDITSVFTTEFNKCFVSVIKISEDKFVVKLEKMQDLKDIDKLISEQFITKNLSEFLISAIKSGDNIILSGDVATGKTTFIDSLLTTIFPQSSVIIFEDYKQLLAECKKYIKVSNSKVNNAFLTELFKVVPEFCFCDSKDILFVAKLINNLQKNIPALISINASSADEAVFKLENALMTECNYPEKYAKRKVLSNFDYIIQLNKDDNGICKIENVSQLGITKGYAQIIKEIYNCNDSEIPEPEDFTIEE